MPKLVNAEWIAVDWGSSRLRTWAMQGSSVLAQAESGNGIGGLMPGEFEPVLLRQIGEWLPQSATPVIACGMIGARQGWVETPYRVAPAEPAGVKPVPAPAQDPRLQVHILPGLSQKAPPDVMRGEETQIAGFLTLNPGWDGVLCLPGTHSKWVHLSANEAVSFQTFMTGELFALLGRNSVLRHSVGNAGWDDAAFADALDEVRSRPERLAALLFGLRAGDILHSVPGKSARARLSGLLIGAELAAARPYWLGQQIAVIGAQEVAMPYVKALELQGVPARTVDSAKMTLTGLTAAWRNLRTAT